MEPLACQGSEPESPFPTLLRPPPLHLACALLSTSLLWLGSGASCEPNAAPENPPPQTRVEEQSPPPEPAAIEPPPPPSSAERRVAARPEAPKASPQRRRYVVAALGDSLTDRRSGGGGYLDVLSQACPEILIDNYGKGGDMVNQMRRRFERELLPRAKERGYTHLLLYGGVNDLYSDESAGRTNDRIESDLGAIYRMAREQGLRVVGITVSPWGGFTRYFTPKRAETTRQLNHWIVAQKAAGAIDSVVDSYPLLSCGDPERLCPAYARPDGLHLAPEGQRVLGTALLEAVFADCS